MKQTKNPYYWYLIPLFVISIIQLLSFYYSRYQLRYEELAESYRNVYWYRKDLIYDYLGYNIGWYSLLDAVYGLFGFHVYAAKGLKYALLVISNFSTLYLCFKIFKNKLAALIPFTVYTLSPALVYFSTIQAQYGLDLIYFPILMLLAVKSKRPIFALLFGFFISLCFFTYAVFYFSLPFIVLFFLSFIRSRKSFFLAFIGGLLPVINLSTTISKYHLFQYYRNLFFSMQTTDYVFNIPDFIKNLQHLFSDLFIRANSYNFEHILPDFSLVFPLIPIFVSFYLIYKYRHKLLPYWKYGLLPILLVIYNLYVVQFKNGPSSDPGMRRSTVILISFYLIYLLGWYLSVKFKHKFIILILLLLPLHHLIVYLPNALSLKKPSQYSFKMWFDDRPFKLPSQNPLVLDCRDLPRESWYKECRFAEIFAVYKLYCHYENKTCQPIYGFDPKTNQPIPLTPEIWTTLYWPH